VPNRPSARDLGIPFDGETGPHNAITDVAGVEVGHTTLIEGDGPLVIGKGPIRTGVTAIHPLGKEILGPVAAGWFPFNGNGEMTGTTWIEESGLLTGPILLTNTLSIGTVRDAVIKWGRRKQEAAGIFDPNDYSSALALPVVAETWDGGLNDIFGFHVREEHVAHALDSAQAGPVPQGNVGGGTGMTCYDFKGGIGTASRIVNMPAENRRGLSPFVEHGPAPFSESAQKKGTVPFSPAQQKGTAPLSAGGEPSGTVPFSGVRGEKGDCPPLPGRFSDSPYTLGVLVQANHGKRSDLLIRGVPVGRELPLSEILSYRDSHRKGSILIIIATDAPLLPHQLKRLARRATLGLARTGTIGNNSSGDIFLAFSTARGLSRLPPSPLTGEGRGEGARVLIPEPLAPSPYFIANDEMDPLFEATTEATEEAIINALVGAETMTGRDHHTAHALPHQRLQEIMRKYNRLQV
jgi:D-aminopeptidase